MSKLYLLIVLLLCCFQSPPPAIAIVGGSRDYTWVKYWKPLVSIRTTMHSSTYYGDNHICGGVLISPKLVLTVASCLRPTRGKGLKRDKVIVVAGQSRRTVQGRDMSEHKIKRIIIHKDYRPGGKEYDIAMLVLKTEVPHDLQYMKTVDIIDESPNPGEGCHTVGWGRVIANGPLSDEALHIEPNIIDRGTCEKDLKVVEGTLCAGFEYPTDEDVCSGDSGGPLYCRGKLAGLILGNEECGDGKPSLYTDVTQYKDWIEKNSGYRNKENIKLCITLIILMKIFSK